MFPILSCDLWLTVEIRLTCEWPRPSDNDERENQTQFQSAQTTPGQAAKEAHCSSFVPTVTQVKLFNDCQDLQAWPIQFCSHVCSLSINDARQKTINLEQMKSFHALHPALHAPASGLLWQKQDSWLTNDTLRNFKSVPFGLSIETFHSERNVRSTVTQNFEHRLRSLAHTDTTISKDLDQKMLASTQSMSSSSKRLASHMKALSTSSWALATSCSDGSGTTASGAAATSGSCSISFGVEPLWGFSAFTSPAPASTPVGPSEAKAAVPALARDASTAILSEPRSAWIASTLSVMIHIWVYNITASKSRLIMKSKTKHENENISFVNYMCQSLALVSTTGQTKVVTINSDMWNENVSFVNHMSVNVCQCQPLVKQK